MTEPFGHGYVITGYIRVSTSEVATAKRPPLVSPGGGLFVASAKTFRK
jgi:hypothetical protein